MTERDKLICANTGLVHACANKFKGKGVDYEELYSAGCVGLIKAADRFDESLGFKFSTYAVPVILGEIKQIFRDNSVVKVSRSLRELSLKITRVCEQYLRVNGAEPTVSQLAAMLSEKEELVSQAIASMHIPVSLSFSSGDEEFELEIPVDSGEEEITERLTLYQHLSELEENDRKLIELRYFSQKTQSVVAELLGMTQVQVSRREKKILASLRQKIGTTS